MKVIEIKKEIEEIKDLLDNPELSPDEREDLENIKIQLEKDLKEAEKAEEEKPKAEKPKPVKKPVIKKDKDKDKPSIKKAKETSLEKKPIIKEVVSAKDVDPETIQWCQALLKDWRKRRTKAKVSKRKTKSIMESIAGSIQSVTKKAIKNVGSEKIKENPKITIDKFKELEKAMSNFLRAFKSVLGEDYEAKEIQEAIKPVEELIQQIREKYVKKIVKDGGMIDEKLHYKVIELFSNGDSNELGTFKTEKEARKFFDEQLTEDGYKPTNTESWSIELNKVDKNGDIETIESQEIYREGTMDRMFYKGKSPINYWYQAFWNSNEKELKYTFYFYGKKQDETVLESELKDWYYKS